MSSRFVPPRPTPSAVYWRRRALVFGGAGLLIWGLWALISPDGDPAAKNNVVSSNPARAGATTSADRSTTGHGSDRSGKNDTKDANGSQPGGKERAAKGTPGDEAQAGAKQAVRRTEKIPSATPTPQPVVVQPRPKPATPACGADALSIQVRPAKKDLPVGFPLPVAIEAKNLSGTKCQVRTAAKQVRMVVMSGSDRVWDSEDCPTVVPETELTLEPAKAKSVLVMWSGRRSSQGKGCPSEGPSGKPGSYSVQVAVAGALSDPATFTLR